MEHYWTTLLFNYLPHVAVFLLIAGLVGRFVYLNKTIHAKSTQFLQDDTAMKISLNLFHYGILFVLLGHFLGLFTPRWMYLWLMSEETKRMLALTCGGFFGACALIGIFSLFIRRVRHERVRINSGWGDIAIEIILCVQIFLGLSATATTATQPLSTYTLFDTWAQAVITFQPQSGVLIMEMPWIYKVHIVCGCLIFIILPYTKLVHFFVAPVKYIWRRSYQLVWRRKADVA